RRGFNRRNPGPARLPTRPLPLVAYPARRRYRLRDSRRAHDRVDRRRASDRFLLGANDWRAYDARPETLPILGPRIAVAVESTIAMCCLVLRESCLWTKEKPNRPARLQAFLGAIEASTLVCWRIR